MSEPAPVLPDTKLDEARAGLHAALAATLVALGWTAARAQPYPPAGMPRGMAGWVDVPVCHQVATADARGVAATFPVLVVVDGEDRRQVAQQDKLLAYLWTELEAVTVPGVHSVLVNTAGPADVDVGGEVARGLSFTVQLTMLVRTFCPAPLTEGTSSG